jgi:hypothetical protein
MNADSKPTVTTEQLNRFVLDVLRHDAAEQLSSILNLLNNDGCIGWRAYWPHDFTAVEVAPALEELLRAGWVTALREDKSDGELVPVDWRALDTRRDQESLWFALTPQGRKVWEGWDPPR